MPLAWSDATSWSERKRGMDFSPGSTFAERPFPEHVWPAFRATAPNMLGSPFHTVDIAE